MLLDMLIHCKIKLEVDLMSSQLQSRFIQVVTHLLLPFKVTSLV